MNSVRICYMIVMMITDFVLLGVAIGAPIWLTPGYYWWTAFCIFLMFSNAVAFTNRLNSWGWVGRGTSAYNE